MAISCLRRPDVVIEVGTPEYRGKPTRFTL